MALFPSSSRRSAAAPWSCTSTDRGRPRGGAGGERDAGRHGQAGDRALPSTAAPTASWCCRRPSAVLLVERYGVAPWRVEIVPPGVDLDRFAPGDGSERERLGLSPGCWTAVVARRLVPRMGLEVLLRSWGELSRRRGDPASSRSSARDRCARAWRQLARELGIGVERPIPRTRRRRRAARLVPGGRRLRDADGRAGGLRPGRARGARVRHARRRDGCGWSSRGRRRPGRSTRSCPPGDHAALARRLAGARDGSVPLPSPERCRAHAERFTWAGGATSPRDLRVGRRPSRRRRPRIVFLDHCAQLSGGEIAMARTLEALGGVDVHVILAEDGPLVARLTRAGVSVEVVAMPERARGLKRDRVTPREASLGAALASGGHVAALARRLRRLAPDLVETNSLKSALYGAVAARSSACRSCGTSATGWPAISPQSASLRCAPWPTCRTRSSRTRDRSHHPPPRSLPRGGDRVPGCNALGVAHPPKRHRPSASASGGRGQDRPVRP